MNKNLFMVVAVLLLCSAGVQGAVVDSNWVGGSSGSWGQASNWNPAIVPDNGDGNTFVVTIDANGFGVDAVDVGFTQSRVVDELICKGVELEKWTSNPVELTLVDPNGLQNFGGEFDSGEVTIIGNVTNKTGAYMFLTDTQIEDGNLVNENNAKLEIEYMVDVDPGSFTNSGWVFIIPASELWIDGGQLTNNGVIQIKNGTIGNGEDAGIVSDFVNASSGNILGSGNVISEANVVNEGNITALSGDLAVYAEGQISNTGLLESKIGSSLHLEMGVSDFNNLGQIKVKANGAVTVKSGKIFGEPGVCTLNNEPNATIKLFGGALAAGQIIQKRGATLEGFGSITGDVMIDPNGLIALTGPTIIVGDVNIAPNATLEISDGTTLITDQTACNHGTIHMIGGRIIPQGGFTDNNCNIIWEPGTYNNIADFNLDGQVNFKDFADFADTWLWQASWYD